MRTQIVYNFFFVKTLKQENQKKLSLLGKGNAHIVSFLQDDGQPVGNINQNRFRLSPVLLYGYVKSIKK